MSLLCSKTYLASHHLLNTIPSSHGSPHSSLVFPCLPILSSSVTLPLTISSLFIQLHLYTSSSTWNTLSLNFQMADSSSFFRPLGNCYLWGISLEHFIGNTLPPRPVTLYPIACFVFLTPWNYNAYSLCLLRECMLPTIWNNIIGTQIFERIAEWMKHFLMNVLKLLGRARRKRGHCKTE